jgi:hypothetical protein
MQEKRPKVGQKLRHYVTSRKVAAPGQMRLMVLNNLPKPSSRTKQGIYSAFNGNEYQRQK